MHKLLKFLLFKFKNKDVIDRYHEIKDFPYLAKDENDKRVLNKLNKLLNDAYKNIPYYNEIFEKSGIVLNGVVNLKNINELQCLPFMTKDIINQQKENLYSSEILNRKSYKNTSGGSTGEPVVFMQDREYQISRGATAYILESWRGAGLYDSRLFLWWAERDTFEGKKPLMSYVKNFISNSTVLNTFIMSDKDIRNYIDILNSKKPTLIIAYAQSIYEIAKFAKINKIKVEKQKAIHSAAGNLYEFMRTEIEEVFGCKVFNHYGSREVSSIASECSAHDGLHIMMDHTLVEVVDKNGDPCKPGEEGEIVVTTLNNFSMPLIRYKIGDVGIMQEYKACACGCNYPKLQKVTGRTTDLFKTAKGALVDGEFFTHLFYFTNHIKVFQVVQEKVDEIVIKIVKNGEITESKLVEIKEKIKIVMGAECNVFFDFVDNIPKTKTGKFLYTISKV